MRTRPEAEAIAAEDEDKDEDKDKVSTERVLGDGKLSEALALSEAWAIKLGKLGLVGGVIVLVEES